MAFAISDTEYVLARQRNDAASALGSANTQVQIANGEIARLRRQLAAANKRMSELETENRSLAEKLIGFLRRQ